MSSHRESEPGKASALKRRILATLAAGPACLIAAAVVTVPMVSEATVRAPEVSEQLSAPHDQANVNPDGTPSTRGRIAQFWANIPVPAPWGNWNNWHNWPNWHDWHNGWGNGWGWHRRR